MALLLAARPSSPTSEAALFYLRRSERRFLAEGNRSQRMAAATAGRSGSPADGRAVLEPLVNLAYFAVAAVVGIQLERGGRRPRPAFLCARAAHHRLRRIAAEEPGRPEAADVGAAGGRSARGGGAAAGPAAAVFRLANLLSRRLLWPRFQAEPYSAPATWSGRCGSRPPTPRCWSRSNGCWRTSCRFRRSAATS